jgi:hypothetical protein
VVLCICLRSIAFYLNSKWRRRLRLFTKKCICTAESILTSILQILSLVLSTISVHLLLSWGSPDYWHSHQENLCWSSTFQLSWKCKFGKDSRPSKTTDLVFPRLNKRTKNLKNSFGPTRFTFRYTEIEVSNNAKNVIPLKFLRKIKNKKKFFL